MTVNISLTPGMKTSEFLATLLFNVANFVVAIQGDLSTRNAILASGISAGLYAISRGLAKTEPKPTPPQPPQA